MSQKIEAIRTAYSFFHQKYQVYRYSTLDWQKEDIEYAIAEYADAMDSEILAEISAGNPDYLRSHQTFARDLADAVEKLEQKI